MHYWDDEKTIREVFTIMQSGEVIVGTSDTVIGLLAPLTMQGFESLNRIKGRYEKPYLVLVKSREEALKLIQGEPSGQILSMMSKCWPGPLTLIFKAKGELPAYLKGPSGTIAVRVPDHAGLQKLLALADCLFSTSANKAGEPVPETFADLDPSILREVKLVVEDCGGDGSKIIQTVPSTILDCSGDTIRVVREGAYPVEALLGKRGN